MQLTLSQLRIDPEETQLKITRFVKDYVDKTKTRGIVLGVSGGVDSAVNAALCAKAIGGSKVLGLYMPEEETYSRTDHQHVALLARTLKIQVKTIDLTKTLRTLGESIPDYEPAHKLSRGNLKARTRMAVWYYYANRQNRLVAASTDKSEIMIGYCTKWGDGAADIAPLMDLYKTQVQQLALFLGIPSAIAKKPPTPALWPKQTAKAELGLDYDTLDLILHGLEHFMSTRRIADQLALPTRTVRTIKRRWLTAEHKRHMPLSLKLGYRTVNHDFRLSRTTELGE